MITTYIIHHKLAGGLTSTTLWERNTNNGRERCIYDSDNNGSYKEWTTDFSDQNANSMSLPKLKGAKRISRADALLEMI